MRTRIWQIIVKEFIQFRRDRVLVLFILAFPLLQLVLIARATGGDVANLPAAILDQDRSAASRAIIQALDNTQEITVNTYAAGVAELQTLLDEGHAALAVIIPPSLASDLMTRGHTPQVQIIVDGSNISGSSTALRAAQGAVNSALQRYLAQQGSRLLSGAVRGGPGSQAVTGGANISLQVNVQFNPELNGKYVAIPGLFAFIIYQVTMVVAAMSLVRERELGTLEQLVVTPVRRVELLAGKALPAVTIGMTNFTVLVLALVHGLDIPMRGSWSLLFLLSTLFLIAVVGIGLMISTVAHTQQQTILIIFPLAMIDLSLSGYLVPVENVPAALRTLSIASPLRHYMAILRDVMLKGADLSTLASPVIALSLLTLILAALTTANVARSLD